MKKLIYAAAAGTGLLFLLCLTIHASTGYDGWEAAAITFGVTFYHFAMRLTVGLVIHRRYRNRMDHTRRWFAEKRFEPRLYALLWVQAWKRYLPTYDAGAFSLQDRTPEELIGAMCQAEVIHEIITVLSLLPIALIPRFGEPAVFVLTSVGAAMFDLLFVILQRYNRPRVLRLLARLRKRHAGNGMP